MDRPLLAQVAEALSAESSTDPAVFVDCFLAQTNHELWTLYYSLTGENPSPEDAGKMIFALTRRVDLARNVFEQLRAANGAATAEAP